MIAATVDALPRRATVSPHHPRCTTHGSERDNLVYQTLATAVFVFTLIAGAVPAAAALDPMPMPEQPAANAVPATAAAPTNGQIAFERIDSLIGTWDAPTKQGVLTDIFKPFALGTDILGEEWIGGKQITSTIFYMVGTELHADHYCDYLNQPHYVVMPTLDPSTLNFEFRSATNLDSHPMHFHSTTWHFIDATHLVQDWYVIGGTKPVALVHLAFTKRS